MPCWRSPQPGATATLDWLRLLFDSPLSPYWDNAFLPSTVAQLFTDNEFARPVATLPWMVPVAYLLGIGVVVFTAAKMRRGSEAVCGLSSRCRCWPHPSPGTTI